MTELEKRIATLSKSIHRALNTGLHNKRLQTWEFIALIDNIQTSFTDLKQLLVHVNAAAEQGATVEVDSKGQVVYCRREI